MHWVDKTREVDYVAFFIYIFVDLPFRILIWALDWFREMLCQAYFRFHQLVTFLRKK